MDDSIKSIRLSTPTPKMENDPILSNENKSESREFKPIHMLSPKISKMKKITNLCLKIRKSKSEQQ